MGADSIGTWLGISLSVAGFGVTFWQLARTRSAAESAQKATERAQGQLVRHQLLSLVPELSRFESDLLVVVGANDKERVVSALLAWRNTAAEVLGLLSEGNVDGSQLAEDLRTAIGASVVAATSVQARTTSAGTREVRHAIALAVAAAGEYSSKLRTYTA